MSIRLGILMIKNGNMFANIYKTLNLDNSFWLLSEKILRILFSIYTFAAIAKYLGPNHFGQFSYYLNYIMLFLPVWALGINHILKKYFALQPNEISNFIISGIILKLASTLIIFTIFFISDFIQPTDNPLLFFILLISFLFRSFDPIELYLDSSFQSKRICLIKFFATFSSTILTVLAIKYMSGLLVFAAIFSLEFLIIGTSCLFIYIKMFPKPEISKTKNIFTTLLKEAWPILVADIFMSLQMKTSSILINYLHNHEQVAIFTVATKLSSFLLFIPSMLALSMFTPVIQKKHAGQEAYYHQLSVLYFTLTYIWLFTCLCLIPFAGFIIDNFFSHNYHQSVTPLIVLLISNLFIFWGFAQEPIDLAEGLIKFRLTRVITGFISSVVFQFLLIPKYQATGAAVAILISCFCTYVLSNILSKKAHFIMKLQLQSFYKFDFIKKA